MLKVSVIMLTYLHEAYIKESVEGVLLQNCDFDIELLIADDNSPDNTEAVIHEISKNHPKGNCIKYCKHKKNKGAMRNFIWASKMAQGQYVALCEGDDYWTDPYKLQKQVDFLDSNPQYVITGHDAIIIDEEGKLISDSAIEPRSKRDGEASELKFSFGILTLSMVYRNLDILRNFPKEGYKIANGETFLISVFGLYGDYKYMPEIQPAVYRIHNKGSWSSLSQIKKIEKQSETYFQVFNFQRKNNADALLKLQLFKEYFKRTKCLLDEYKKAKKYHKYSITFINVFFKCYRFRYPNLFKSYVKSEWFNKK